MVVKRRPKCRCKLYFIISSFNQIFFWHFYTESHPERSGGQCVERWPLGEFETHEAQLRVHRGVRGHRGVIGPAEVKPTCLFECTDQRWPVESQLDRISTQIFPGNVTFSSSILIKHESCLCVCLSVNMFRAPLWGGKVGGHLQPQGRRGRVTITFIRDVS